MLTRRFTIVCLVTLLFGLFFADLVARAAFDGRFGARNDLADCVWKDAELCRQLSDRP